MGKGAFGKVNLAIHRLSGKFVALKSINKQFMTEESSKRKIMQEFNILRRTKHDNIVKLYESFETPQHIVFVMEVCGGGDLLSYVRKRRKLKEEVACHLFRQVIIGLQYCHSQGVLHRDVKLDNILLTSQGTVKICDFGVSKLITKPKELMFEQCGTPAYIAPEIFENKGYVGYQSDVWSSGVVLYTMLYGAVPFKASNM
jgi:NUAK family SNF1-like kinase